MTYCVGILLEQGLVLASDTRTNAGVDQVATADKMHVFDAKDRVVVLMTAGNLAITQSVINILREQTKQDDGDNILNVGSLYDAASLVGQAMREVYQRDGKALKQHGINFSASVLVAGQIKGERARLFNVYAAGNFIEAGQETPYLQIGETKYGTNALKKITLTMPAFARAGTRVCNPSLLAYLTQIGVWIKDCSLRALLRGWWVIPN